MPSWVLRCCAVVAIPLVLGAAARRGPDDALSVRTERQRALAERIDQTLEASHEVRGIAAAPLVDDATFLRRLSLDLCGTIPTREEVSQFLADPRADKRERKIDEYLHDGAWAENFSSFWARPLLEAANRRQEGSRLRPWLEQAFRDGMPFADVVREVVGGRGRSDSNGATGFALSYAAEPESMAAVTARTFLGLQIQCAQCHDHPYDDWTQDEFNGFTAFFTPIRSSRVDPGTRGFAPVYRLYDVDREEQRQDRLRRLVQLIHQQDEVEGAEPEMEREMEALGSGSKQETGALLAEGIRGELDEGTLEQLLRGLPPTIQERILQAREREEKYGSARFLDGGEYQDTTLLTPREALAEWIVDEDNPYFAHAVVNRVWAHFFGKGMIEPLDDLTGAEDRILPQLLDTLAAEFHHSGTDLAALVGILVRTRSYARAPAPAEADPATAELAERWFAAHPVRPLDAEQMLHALLRASGIEQYTRDRRRGNDFEGVRSRLLARFRYAFSDDENGEGDSFAAGIPQALFLLNGRLTNDSLELRDNQLLQGILAESVEDGERLTQLFRATLGRDPTPVEANRLPRLMKGSRRYGRGLEDLHWALLNSSEFLTNH